MGRNQGTTFDNLGWVTARWSEQQRRELRDPLAASLGERKVRAAKAIRDRKQFSSGAFDSEVRNNAASPDFQRSGCLIADGDVLYRRFKGARNSGVAARKKRQ